MRSTTCEGQQNNPQKDTPETRLQRRKVEVVSYDRDLESERVGRIEAGGRSEELKGELVHTPCCLLSRERDL